MKNFHLKNLEQVKLMLVRFDEKTFDVRRAEAELAYTSHAFVASAGYAYIDAQPTYGFATERQEVNGSATLRFEEFWRVSGNATYDITNRRLARTGIGLAYDDECFAIGLHWLQTRDNTNVKTNTFGFRIALRTLGDFGTDINDSSNY